MSSSILELRQLDSAPIYQATPGEWETILHKPITIEEGDQIVMKNCFLDTVAASQDRIVVPNPISLQFDVGYYIQSVRPDAQDNSAINNTAYLSDTSKGFVDGKSYILMDRHDAAGGGFYFNGFQCILNGSAEGFPNDSSLFDKGSSFTLEYYPPGGAAAQPNTKTMTFDFVPSPLGMFPGINAPLKNGNFISPASNPYFHSIIYDPTRNVPGHNQPIIFSATHPKQSRDPLKYISMPISQDGNQFQINISYDKGSSPFAQYTFNLLAPASPTDAVDGTNVMPFSRKDPVLGQVIVPKGTYDPVQLCSVVNRQLQLNNPVLYGTDGTQFVNSAFFASYNPDKAPFANTFWLASDLSNATEYTNASLAGVNGGILVGASQMVLDYDQAAGQFMWSYIHSPYDGSQDQDGLTESAGITVSENLAANNNQPVPVSRNSGVYFTNIEEYEYIGGNVEQDGNGRMSIVGGTQRQSTFMETQLGFNLDTLVVKQTTSPQSKTIGTLVMDKLFLDANKLQIGVNTTTGFFGLDGVVDREDNNTWWHLPDLAQGSFFSAITGNTIPIYNEQTKSRAGDNVLHFGYFLIDIAAKFNNEYIGNRYSSQNIRAIISRYYEQNSYTTGSAADAVPYVHEGDPVMLQSFRVRVLQGNKSLAPNLQTDNTIIMEVVKAPKKNMPQITN